MIYIFIIKEQCELYAICQIVRLLHKELNNYFYLLNPSNTDFDYFDIDGYLKKNLPQLSKIELSKIDYNNSLVIGLSNTNKTGELDYLRDISIPIEYLTSIDNFRFKSKVSVQLNKDKKNIVIGNIKMLENSLFFKKKYQTKILEISKNYNLILVPRHPVEKSVIEKCQNMGAIVINEIGVLRYLYSIAHLTIMGRIFNPQGFFDTEHNLFEATQNSNTLCASIKNPSVKLDWIINKSGLVHQFSNLENLFKNVDYFLNDENLRDKLINKELKRNTDEMESQLKIKKLLKL